MALYTLAFSYADVSQRITMYAFGMGGLRQEYERRVCALFGVIFWGLAALVLGAHNAATFRRMAGGEPLHPSEFAGSSHPLVSQAMPLETVPLQVELDPVSPEATPAAEVDEAPILRGAVLIEDRPMGNGGA